MTNLTPWTRYKGPEGHGQQRADSLLRSVVVVRGSQGWDWSAFGSRGHRARYVGGQGLGHASACASATAWLELG